MGTRGERCPNCHHPMEILRSERQAAGSRAVRLVWARCDTCRHVALRAWAFEEQLAVGRSGRDDDDARQAAG